MIKQDNKTEFIIVRVKKTKKSELRARARELGVRFSSHIRTLLGVDD